MAIDTANRRSAAINPGCPWRSQWPLPDGVIGPGDREQTAYLYRAMLAQTFQHGPLVFSAGAVATNGLAAGTAATNSFQAGAAVPW